MTEAEYRALGEALRTMPEAIWPAGVAATRFLALTGWRRGEMLALKWSEIDLAIRTARLADTKTGASLRPLGRWPPLQARTPPNRLRRQRTDSHPPEGS
jgi:integrase